MAENESNVKPRPPRPEEDLHAVRSYLETEQGMRGDTNADLLARLIVHLADRLEALEGVVQRIGDSLEGPVATRLHDMRQRLEVLERTREGNGE